MSDLLPIIPDRWCIYKPTGVSVKTVQKLPDEYLLPGTNLLLARGKEGPWWELDREVMWRCGRMEKCVTESQLMRIDGGDFKHEEENTKRNIYAY